MNDPWDRPVQGLKERIGREGLDKDRRGGEKAGQLLESRAGAQHKWDVVLFEQFDQWLADFITQVPVDDGDVDRLALHQGERFVQRGGDQNGVPEILELGLDIEGNEHLIVDDEDGF